jgi:hypothetical protein
MGSLSFLNAGFLFFLAAAILPLLIWLLAKKKPKQVVFPTIRFIKTSQEQEKKKTRFKNILLLIIRMLIILLVTLAATRPLFSSPRLKPSAHHPPTALAVLIDNSYSMNYVYDSRSNLDRAKDALKKINSLSNPDDRLIPVCSDENWNRLHSQIYANSIPENIIESISVTYEPLTLPAMLKQAKNRLQETQFANQEIYLITDGQKQEYPSDPDLTLQVINIAENKDFSNLSCSQAQVLPKLAEKSRRQTIEFKLTNYGNQDRHEVLIRTVLGEAKVGEKFVNLPARQTVNQSMVIDLQKDGWQSGYVEVVDDYLEEDNRSYFAFPFYFSPQIAVITQNRSLPPTINSLLRVYAGSEGKIHLIEPQQLNLSMLDQYQSYIFLSTPSFPPQMREIINFLQNSNRGALFCLSSNISPEYKSFLENIFKVKFGAWQSQPKSINYINPHHFTTALLAGKSLHFNTISDFWHLDGMGINSLLSGSGEVFSLAKDKFILWNFDPASERSTFLLDAAFPVFAYRCLEHTSSSIASGEKYIVGDIINTHSLITPGGETLLLSNRPYKLSQPGIYILQKADRSETVIAVETPRQESEFIPMDYDGLKNVQLLGDNWQDKLFATRLGYELGKILLAIALALVILEIILVKSEELRSVPKAVTNSGS